MLVSVAKDRDCTPSLFLAVHDLALELDRLGGGIVLYSRLPPHGSLVAGRVSIRFGMRLHTRFERWRSHKGVDIAARSEYQSWHPRTARW